jgi:hypothetical protein
LRYLFFPQLKSRKLGKLGMIMSFKLIEIEHVTI